MPAPDPKDIYAPDANDYNFVSIKNWYRKQKSTNGNDQISNLVGRPGPITGFVIGIVDVIVTLIVKFTINLITISTFAFDWLYNMIFGNFNGIIPTSITGGTVISMKFFRYTMTVLMPPFGILLSKGLYSWFNVLICIVITYINYMAGIIYAFVITARNRYSDQYEAHQIKKALNDPNNQSLKSTIKDTSALFGTCGFITLLGLVFFIIFSFF